MIRTGFCGTTGKGFRMKKSTVSKQIRLDLPLTQLQLATLCLALDNTLAGGLSDVADCFPDRPDLANLKRLSDRCWRLLKQRFYAAPGSRGTGGQFILHQRNGKPTGSKQHTSRG